MFYHLPPNPSHEIGHYLFARRHCIEIEYATILSGNGVLPHVMPKATEVLRWQYVEFLLGGWAAEAYVASHSEDDAKYDPRALALMAPRTGRGSGWWRGLAGVGDTDVDRLVKGRVDRRDLCRPWPLLARMGRHLHRERAIFYRLVQRLVIERFLCGAALAALEKGDPWTVEISSLNEQALEKALSHGKIYRGR